MPEKSLIILDLFLQHNEEKNYAIPEDIDDKAPLPHIRLHPSQNVTLCLVPEIWIMSI